MFASLVSGYVAPSRTLAAEAESTAPKPYTLYMGTDFAVQQGKDFLPVRDVKGKAFVVRTKKGDVLVPMTGGQVNLKIETALKIAATTAAVTNLKTERAYTPAKDPVRQFNQSTGGSLADAAALDLAIGEQVRAEQSMGALSNLSPLMQGPGAMQAASNRLNAANAAQNQAMQTVNFSTMNNTGDKAFSLQQALADELYDAMEVSFEVSSPEYLDKPYIVVIVRYHEKDTTSRSSANWIYAKAIPPVAAGAEKIHFLQGGLPEGFVKCQVRLYNRGREIATNVAPKRMQLTADDAFDFLKVKHITSNKTASVPAAPALAGFTTTTKASLTPAQLNQTYYVKVSENGRALGAFTDEACSSPVDPVLDAVIKNVLFYPALKAGKPVEGTSLLVLSQLSL
jgi:hypothetical protein